MTNIKMNYAIKSLSNYKRYFQGMMIVPVLGILAVTGCSNLDGIADRQAPTKNGVAVYSEWKQEKLKASDSNPDPGYEWFY